MAGKKHADIRDAVRALCAPMAERVLRLPRSF
jgi:hypothetical protein